MPPLQHPLSDPHNTTTRASSPQPPFFPSRPSLSTTSTSSNGSSSSSSSSSTSSDSSLDHSFRQLTLREAQRVSSLVYGFKEDTEESDLLELYSQDVGYFTQQGQEMLQRRDSWDDRTSRESGHMHTHTHTHTATAGESVSVSDILYEACHFE